MTTNGPDFPAVIELARTAPSIHNTQPWLFHAEGDVLTLLYDDDRRLTVLDPDARSLTISCGAALYLARLGLRLQGFDATVEIPPAFEGPTRELARIHVRTGPPVTAEEVVLEHAARSRHTQRGPFDSVPVEDDTIESLRDAVQDEGAWVRVLSTSEEQVGLAVLLSRADDAERQEEGYAEELAAWTNRPTGAADGLTPEAVAAASVPRPSSLRLREFGDGDPEPGDSGGSDDDPPKAEHPLVAIIGTDADTRFDWLLAGQAMCSLLLHAGADGVQASPMSQVVDQPWTRRRLASELGCVGYPQMVLRLGHARPGPQTPRRAVDDLII
jgi:hypothetical protein